MFHSPFVFKSLIHATSPARRCREGELTFKENEQTTNLNSIKGEDTGCIIFIFFEHCNTPLVRGSHYRQGGTNASF